MASIKI